MKSSWENLSKTFQKFDGKGTSNPKDCKIGSNNKDGCFVDKKYITAFVKNVANTPNALHTYNVNEILENHMLNDLFWDKIHELVAT